MAVLRAYLDDSGKANDPQHELIVFAGYAGPVEAWEETESRWAAVLREYDMPYLHMRDFAHLAHPFDVFRSNRKTGEEFLTKLIEVIRGQNLYGASAVVRLNDLKKFNRDYGQEVDPTVLAIYGSTLELFLKFGKSPVEVIVDRFEKPYAAFAKVKNYAATDRYYTGCGDNIEFSIIPQALSFRDLAAVQVADLAAWETRRAHSMQTEWYEQLKPRSNHPNDWVPSLTEWQLNRFGRAPAERSSFGQLMRMAKVEGIVWDYDAIVSAHNARGGIWDA